MLLGLLVGRTGLEGQRIGEYLLLVPVAKPGFTAAHDRNWKQPM